jgi:Protein phosphatase 2C
MGTCLSTTASAWRVGGASIVGTSHMRQNTYCQDAHDYAALPDGSLVISIADGAGSASRSDEGATIAATAAVAALKATLSSQSLPDNDSLITAMQRAFHNAQEAIVHHAAETGEPLRSFATTLTGVVCRRDRVVVGQIGDGAAVVERENGTFSTAILPQQGEYVGETYFLTMSDALTRMETAILTEPIRSVTVMTDGLMRLALQLPACSPHPPFFIPRIDLVRETDDPCIVEAYLREFLASERVCDRTDDDKTLVIAAVTNQTSSEVSDGEAVGICQ